MLGLLLWSVHVFAQPAAGGESAAQPAAGGQTAGKAGSAEEPAPPHLVIGVGGARSDNILRTTDNTENGTYLGPTLDFGLSRDAPRLAATLDGNLEHRRYDVDGIPSELYGTLDASVELRAVPDRFSWFFGDNYGQASGDPFQIDNPVNREHINAASTGPRLRLPLGTRTQLRLDGTSSRRSFESSSAFDNDARTVLLGISRALTARSEFLVTASRRHTEYSALPAKDSDVDNIYAGYQSRLSSGSASLELGTSRLDSTTHTASTPYIDVRWQRNVGSRSRINLAASSQLIDAVEELLNSSLSGTSVEQLSSILISADVYKSSSAGLTYTMQFPRASLRMGGQLYRNGYETEHSLDNDLRQVRFELNRILTSQLDVGIAAYDDRREFTGSGQTDEDKVVQLSLTKRFGSRFSVLVAYQRDSRDSNSGISFDENTVRLTFLCNLMPRQSAATAGIP